MSSYIKDTAVQEEIRHTSCVYDIPEHYLDHSKIQRRRHRVRGDADKSDPGFDPDAESRDNGSGSDEISPPAIDKGKENCEDGDIVDNLGGDAFSRLADIIIGNKDKSTSGLLVGDLDWWLGGIDDALIQKFRGCEERYIAFLSEKSDTADREICRRAFYADTSDCGAKKTFRAVTGRDFEQIRRGVVVIQRAVRDWIERTEACDHQSWYGPLFTGTRCGRRFTRKEGHRYGVHRRCSKHLCPCMVPPDFGHEEYESTCCVCGNAYCSVCGTGCRCHALPVAIPW